MQATSTPTMMNTPAMLRTVPRMEMPLRPSDCDHYSEPGWSHLQEVMDLMLFHSRDNGFDRTRLFRRIRVRSGQSVFAMGQAFEGLYVVRLGALKTVITHDDGTERVLSFAMRGALLGADGVCKNHYCSDAVALTDCEVIRLPVNELFSRGQLRSELESMAYWAISREVMKVQTALTLSNSPRAQVRVARFLLLQSEGFAAIGYSPWRFCLPMTRRDIGSHLNLTLETVSRTFSILSERGIIGVEKREIAIHHPEKLRTFHR